MTARHLVHEWFRIIPNARRCIHCTNKIIFGVLNDHRIIWSPEFYPANRLSIVSVGKRSMSPRTKLAGENDSPHGRDCFLTRAPSRVCQDFENCLVECVRLLANRNWEEISTNMISNGTWKIIISLSSANSPVLPLATLDKSFTS